MAFSRVIAESRGVPFSRLPAKGPACLVALACALGALPADAFSPFLVVPEPAVAEASPAYRYANMTDAEAFSELDRRHVGYAKLDPVSGVKAPVRLTARLHGVLVHSTLPESQRAQSPFEILDARLALALDDFCALLERHDIDEVVHFTMYRPQAAGPAPASPPAKAKRAAPKARTSVGKRVAKRDVAAAAVSTTTSWAPPGTRHPAGLAVDVAMVKKRDGRWISVQRDFHGRIGQKTCGADVPVPAHPDARELRALVCQSQELGLFTYVLTPDYNAAHADHFHMEIKPGVRWFLYH